MKVETTSIRRDIYLLAAESYIAVKFSISVEVLPLSTRWTKTFKVFCAELTKV